MPTTRVSVPSYLGGISQQPDAVRRNNVVDQASNVEILATEGMIKRSPSVFVKELATGPVVHRVIPLHRDDRSYLIFVLPTEVKILDEAGVTCTVSAPGGYSYLSGATSADIRYHTVADTVFLLNRGVTVAATDGPGRQAWYTEGAGGVFIRQSNYGVKYTVKYKDDSMAEAVEATYTVPNPINLPTSANVDVTGLSAAQVAGNAPISLGTLLFNSIEDLTIRTPNSGGTELPRIDFIADPADRTLTYIGSTLTAGDDIYVERRNDVVLNYYLEHPHILRRLRERLALLAPSADVEFSEDSPALLVTSAEDIEILEGTDSQGGAFMTVWQETVDDITSLPLTFKHGAIVRILGTRADAADDYWVRFATEEWIEDGRDATDFNSFSGFGKGVWIEAAAPGASEGSLTASTLPHVLKRTGATTFTWGPSEWAGRTVGDEVTNEAPSFVGAKIRDIFFHENRLGFLSENAISFSKSGDLTNFFRTTVLSVPPSDRIDAELSALDGDALNHAVPFDRSLMVFSRQAQAAVFGDPYLTPDSIQAPVVAAYRAFPEVEPAVLGTSIFFGYPTGDYAQFREFIPASQQNRLEDSSITLAVEKLIPGDVRRLEAGSDMLLALSPSEPKRLYVYQFMRHSGSLVVAGWTTWDFQADIQDMVFIQDRLFVILRTATGISMERITVGAGRRSTDGDFQIRLDRQTAPLSGTYDRATDTTSFTLPYTVSDEESIGAAVGVSGVLPYGAELQVNIPEEPTNVVTINGDLSDSAVVFGTPYWSQIRLSKALMKGQTQTGTYALLGGNTTVREFHAYLEATGYLEAVVETVGSETAIEEFLADALSLDTLDDGVLRSGEFRIGIHADPKEFKLTLRSTSALPFNLISGAWDIRYSARRLQ